jgi:glycosyltransferase involved in cell wall biosynthesis
MRETYTSVRHIVIFDGLPEIEPPEDFEYISGLCYTTTLSTGKRFGDYGNSVRALGWDYTGGSDFIGYMDDDDIYINDAFNTMMRLIDAEPDGQQADFYVFPCLRRGEHFVPPDISFVRTNHITSIQYIHRRCDLVNNQPIRFTGGSDVAHDGAWIEGQVRLGRKFKIYPDIEPLFRVDRVSGGAFF